MTDYLAKCGSPTCACQTQDACKPEPSSIAAAFQAMDAAREELFQLLGRAVEERDAAKAESEERRLKVIATYELLGKTIIQRDNARAEVDNLFPLLRAAEDQNARYSRELEQLVGAQARLEEMDEALAYAQGAGFDEGYALACKEQGIAS